MCRPCPAFCTGTRTRIFIEIAGKLFHSNIEAHMDTLHTDSIKLTSFSHGGGCGCKISPGLLAEILKSSSGFPIPEQLLVGIETADDAAVYKLNDEQALIATTDFFMPIVDDPFDFGRIAATNAISDVYAMGGTPIMALALVAMPIKQLSIDIIGKSSRGVRQPAARPAFPLRVDTRSIQWSRFTA